MVNNQYFTWRTTIKFRTITTYENEIVVIKFYRYSSSGQKDIRNNPLSAGVTLI